VSPTGTRVGYQGEPGAYSEQAVGKLFPRAEAVPIRTLRMVFEAVERGEVDHGVVPLENSLAGSINEAYDLLSAGHAFIVGEVVVAVDHALLALPGTKVEDLKRVCSHPQALAQCEEYLAMLDVDLIPVYDTAGAAKRIAEEGRTGEGAVASEKAAEIYGLDVLARHIQTSSQNRTRFAAIGPKLEPLRGADKTSLLLELRHEPGSLYRCLRPFAERDLNLTKLESRPIGDRPWEYWFYLDVQAGVSDPALAEALGELQREAGRVLVVGSYARWPEQG
jgi:prephenate dehydratase